MPICITCSTPVRNLYTTYSKADDRTLGKGVRLTQCPNCKRFADKYVEHDYVVLFIDLVLIKPQVYRHLLFNRLGRTDDKVDPSIWRLGTLLVLFDVYITWARIENSSGTKNEGVESRLAQASVITQYLFFLTLNVLATLAQHVTIRVFARWLLGNPTFRAGNDSPNPGAHEATSPMTSHSHGTTINHDDPASYSVGPGNAPPSAISTALLVSSCTKLFPILLVIWPTSTSASSSQTSALQKSSFHSRASSYIGWVVLFNNIEALLILLDCGYVMATGLAMAGVLARWTIEGWLLTMVGLSRDTSGPVGDFLDLVKWMAKGIGYG